MLFLALNAFAFHSMDFLHNYGIWLNQLHTTPAISTLTSRICTNRSLHFHGNKIRKITAVKWRNERRDRGERGVEKMTCSPVPSRSRHGRGTSKSTGVFLPLRRCEILYLLRNRVFFSPRPQNTQITNGADVARTGASMGETDVQH